MRQCRFRPSHGGTGYGSAYKPPLGLPEDVHPFLGAHEPHAKITAPIPIPITKTPINTTIGIPPYRRRGDTGTGSGNQVSGGWDHELQTILQACEGHGRSAVAGGV